MSLTYSILSIWFSVLIFLHSMSLPTTYPEVPSPSWTLEIEQYPPWQSGLHFGQQQHRRTGQAEDGWKQGKNYTTMMKHNVLELICHLRMQASHKPNLVEIISCREHLTSRTLPAQVIQRSHWPIRCIANSHARLHTVKSKESDHLWYKKCMQYLYKQYKLQLHIYTVWPLI